MVAEGGFLYDADSYADDLPYWVYNYGRLHLVIPYTLDANDMRFATAQGFNTRDQFFMYLRDTFDMLYAEGETAPKMMSVGLHCRLVAWRIFSIMCRVMSASGSAAGWILPGTGIPTTNRKRKWCYARSPCSTCPLRRSLCPCHIRGTMPQEDHRG